MLRVLTQAQSQAPGLCQRCQASTSHMLVTPYPPKLGKHALMQAMVTGAS